MQHDITNHNVAVLNLEEALARVDGDHQLLGELAALFLDECPHMLAAIRAALARRDVKALQHAAHTLKGSVGNFGATAVFEAAVALGKMGRHGDFSGADEVCSRLEAELARLQPALAALVTAEVA